MNRKKRVALVHKVLLGNASDSEYELLTDKLRLDMNLRTDFEDVTFLLNNIYPRPYMDEFDTSYYAGLRQIGYQFNSREAHRRSVQLLCRKVAITSLLLLFIFVAVAWITNPYVTSSSYGEKRFSIHHQRLPDNSMITLARNVSFNFFHHPFGRSLFLTGEARLHIPIDSLRPFYLKSSLAPIKTWGGDMFVKSFPDELIKIYVISGALEIGEGSSKSVVLPGENVLIVRTGNIVSVTRNDEDFDFWYTGKMTFEKKALDSVINRIENSYNVIIRADNLPVSDLRFTGIIKHIESVEEILDAICAEFDLQYYEDGVGIYILYDAKRG